MLVFGNESNLKVAHTQPDLSSDFPFLSATFLTLCYPIFVVVFAVKIQATNFIVLLLLWCLLLFRQCMCLLFGMENDGVVVAALGLLVFSTLTITTVAMYLTYFDSSTVNGGI